MNLYLSEQYRNELRDLEIAYSKAVKSKNTSEQKRISKEIEKKADELLKEERLAIAEEKL